MEQLDKNAVSELNYRKKVLDNELRNIRNAANGRGESYLPCITDEGGAVTDALVEQLIDGMLRSLKLYKKSSPRSDAALTEETEELYRCFLYCAVLGIAQEDDFSQYSLIFGLFEPAQAFADIVNMARAPYTAAFPAREELLLSETDPFGYADFRQGFFDYTNAVYEMLTGNSISDTYTAEEKKRVDKIHSAAVEAAAEDYARSELEAARSQGCKTVEEYYARLDEYFRENREEIEGEWETDPEQERLERQAKLKTAALVSRIPDPDKYIRRYLRYRELYFQTRHESIPSDIESMVDAYLYEHKISPFALGEAYGLVLHKVKQFPGMLKSEVRRARRIQ